MNTKAARQVNNALALAWSLLDSHIARPEAAAAVCVCACVRACVRACVCVCVCVCECACDSGCSLVLQLQQAQAKCHVCSFHDTDCCQRTQNKDCCWWGNSRLGVVVVGVHVDVPQAQLVQLPNDFLHGIEVLVLHAIQGAGARVGTSHLWVGEVQQSRSASRNNLIFVCGIQRPIPAR